jgi:hypothetical protein
VITTTRAAVTAITVVAGITTDPPIKETLMHLMGATIVSTGTSTSTSRETTMAASIPREMPSKTS